MPEPTQTKTAKEIAQSQQLPDYSQFGIVFTGQVVSIDAERAWKKNGNSNEVIGTTVAIGLSDGTKIYSWSYKVEEGDKRETLLPLSVVKIKVASMTSDMGQHRINGSLILEGRG